MKRTPLRRKKRMRRFNPERTKKRVEEAFSICARMARLLPCCVCGGPAPSEASHVRSRGANGKDEGNVVPMCSTRVGIGREGCHAKRHRVGQDTFDRDHGMNMEVEGLRVLDAIRAHACANWEREGVCAVCLVTIDGKGI